jgi:hypothetical protein
MVKNDTYLPSTTGCAYFHAINHMTCYHEADLLGLLRIKFFFAIFCLVLGFLETPITEIGSTISS